MSITLNQLKTFLTVVEQGGITLAANTLYMTQPAVSIQIKQLETHFGLPLLEVVGKKIHLTQAGKLLYEAAKEIRNLLTTLETELSNIQGCFKKKLNISAVSTAKYFIPSLLGNFHKLYPDVEIRLKVANRGEVLERLKSNDDDLVVLSQLPKKFPASIVVQKILNDALVVPAPPNHPLAKKQNILFKELKNEPFIAREPGSGTLIAMNKLFNKAKFRPKITMELGSSSAIKQSIIAGFGLSLLSKMSIEQELALKKLVILNIKGFPIQHPWYIVRLKNKKLTPIMVNFIKFLQENAIFKFCNAFREPSIFSFFKEVFNSKIALSDKFFMEFINIF